MSRGLVFDTFDKESGGFSLELLMDTEKRRFVVKKWTTVKQKSRYLPKSIEKKHETIISTTFLSLLDDPIFLDSPAASLFRKTFLKENQAAKRLG